MEIIVNDLDNWTTPSYVAFTDDERLIGVAFKNQIARNPENAVFDAKRVMVGSLRSPSCKLTFQRYSFTVVANVGDLPMIQVNPKGEDNNFTQS